MNAFDFRTELGRMTPLVAMGARIYIFGAGDNWNSIRTKYINLVGIDLDMHIDGFIDNNVKKQGTYFHGKMIYALSEIENDNSVVLVSVATKEKREIYRQLMNNRYIYRHSFFYNDCFASILMNWGYARLIVFKKKHASERCFIIGSGPSLKADDLSKLENEVSFATNRIYLMFSNTKWRPSYYMIQDIDVFMEIYEEINQYIKCTKFYSMSFSNISNDIKLTNGYYFSLDNRLLKSPGSGNKPPFSEDPVYLYWGATVTFSCLQMAAFMGFKEIYLLGIDHSFPVSINSNGEVIIKSVDSRFYLEQKNFYSFPLVDTINNAYISAREYADSHGIKIYNATRGGELEVFERVDFDSLF